MRIVVIKKRNIIVLFLVVLLGISSLFFIEEETNVSETVLSPIMDRVIVIDAGHGGFDPGAIGRLDKNEDKINLEISLRLRRLIEQSGGIVILTREDDNGLNTEKSTTIRQKKNEDLRNRRILINESDPDVFITIHMNSFPQSRYYGAQTFYKSGCEKSKSLAIIVQEELRNVLDKDNKRKPQSRNTVYLINRAETVSILVEAGFLSNSNEEKLLNDPIYQEKVAWAINSGLIKYFNELEKIQN